MGEPDKRRGQTQRLPDDDLPEGSGEVRRTARLDQSGDEWIDREPVNPGWRSERASGRRVSPRRGALPSSPQEFQLWLQAGGWRYLVGIALLFVVLLIAMLAFARGEQREAGLSFSEPTATAADAIVGGLPSEAQPTVTPGSEVAPVSGRFYIVTGTDGQGLFLRPEPSTTGSPITTLPDGTRVEEIGPEVPGGDRLWRRVRAPTGEEGYVAADFLTPAP